MKKELKLRKIKINIRVYPQQKPVIKDSDHQVVLVQEHQKLASVVIVSYKYIYLYIE